MSKPSFTSLRLRRNFEDGVINAFSQALLELILQGNFPEAENKLNRELLRFVYISSAKELWTVQSECNNQPDFESPIKEPREDKRPDFTCSYKDITEENPLKSTKTFIVECKRLGGFFINKKAVNELYIVNGVNRFINKGHGYGAMNHTGAMVGYIQHMDFDEILVEVNNHGLAHFVTPLNLDSTGWQTSGVSILDHSIDRPEIEPSPFKLLHLWADLR